MDKRKNTGNMAEKIAASHLKKNGYLIIEKNFRVTPGEIDIIAKKGGEFVFLEVRSAVGYGFCDPLESIGHNKILRLKRLAQIWLLKNNLYEQAARFDVIAVIFNQTPSFLTSIFNKNIAEIKHIENAF